MRHRISLAVASLALAAAAPPLAADTLVLSASRDATILSENGGRANGAGQRFHTGLTAGGNTRRGLVAFDLSGIPAGSTITAVTLTLFLEQTNTGDRPVALHPIAEAWTEGASDPTVAGEGGGATATAGDVTWTHRTFDTVAWTTAGGDFAATASATTTVGAEGAAYDWSAPAMVADVQGWLDDPASNHGWMVVTTTTANGQAKAFSSDENGTASRRPALSVTFTPPAASGACCATDGSCTVAADADSCAGGFQGADTVCSPNPCPQPEIGACCVPDAAATCVEDTAQACLDLGGTFTGGGATCADLTCPVVLTPYLDPLPLPAVATPTAGAPGGAASYTLRAVELEQTLHAELPPTRVWGYDDGTGGSYPGPTIEARRDQAVQVTWANDLRDEDGALRTAHRLPVDTCVAGAADQTPRTVVHLHGGHVGAESDGHPEDAFAPGEQRVYDYPNIQDAATLWYHDHAMGLTRLNVYLGLAGFYLVRDDAEDALGLPSGTHEVPLAIQDRTIAPDGSLVYPAAWTEHVHGEVVLVNGKVWPFLDVERGKYRFRVLNGSGSRFYTLALSDGATFHQIGSDGGLLAAPVPLTALTLGPGERADLVIDFAGYAPGTAVELVNSAPMMFPGTPGDGVIREVMEFRVGAAEGHTAPLPATLRTIAPLAEGEAAVTRDLTLARMPGGPCGSMWMINELPFDTITEQPQLGTTEIWRFVNRSGVSHPMHMHLVFFQVLDRQPFELVDGVVTPIGAPVPPPAGEAGWKDTVQVGPNEIVRVIARFDDFVGLFPYHCHILEHEDNEMMRQFETTTTCGDGARGLPLEACDDGNTDPGDGCDPECQLEGPVDAGPGAPDADLGEDAGPVPNDGGAVEPDAGSPGVAGGGGGCGCRATGEPGGALPLVVALGWLARRRRRRS